MTGRRSFLITTATTIAAAALPALPISAFAQEKKTLINNLLFLNTGILKGTPEERLRAARHAGFSQIELRKQDVAEMPGGAPAIKQLCGQIGLGLADYQVLSDFDGAPGNKRVEKRAEATKILDDGAASGAKLVLAASTSFPDVDPSRIVEDMQWLADEAKKRGLNIAYEPMSWSSVNWNIPLAWETLQRVGRDNTGIVVDPYHIFTRGRTAEDLNGIPVERLSVVQLCDAVLPVAANDYLQRARHHRLFPGKGNLPLGQLIRKLEQLGYTGPIGLEIYNDQYLREPVDEICRRAMQTLTQVLNANILPTS